MDDVVGNRSERWALRAEGVAVNGRRVLYTTVAGLVVAAHVLLITVGVARAAVWLGGAAAAGLLLALVAGHVEGARRIAARRRRLGAPDDHAR